MTIFALGNNCLTACPTKCAQEWRMISTPSGSLGVMICTAASSVIGSQASRNTPFTLPATVALANPEPMDAAIWATVTGDSYWRMLPSGKVMLSISCPLNEYLNRPPERFQAACICLKKNRRNYRENKGYFQERCAQIQVQAAFLSPKSSLHFVYQRNAANSVFTSASVSSVNRFSRFFHTLW